MYIFLLNSQSHKIVGNPDNYKLLCHLISSSLLLPLNSIRFGARRITFLVTELVTLKSYNSTMSVSYQSTELWMTCGQYCKWFSQEKHLCTGRESTRPVVRSVLLAPFPSLLATSHEFSTRARGNQYCIPVRLMEVQPSRCVSLSVG
jgi:hypothetical protein